MKQTTVFLICFLFTIQLMAQQTFNAGKLTIQKAVVNMFDALSDRDSVALKMHCTQDVAFYEYGQAWTIDTLIEKAIVLNTATDFKRVNTFDFVATTVNKDIAWATYHLQSAITQNGKQVLVQWMETVILLKQKKDWKIHVLHSTLIKRT